MICYRNHDSIIFLSTINGGSFIKGIRRLLTQYLWYRNEPIFNALEIMNGLLKYDRPSDCRWYRKLQKNTKFVVKLQCGNLPHSEFLTKRGFFEVLSKSDKELAMDFRDALFEFVDNLIKQKLDEAQLLIEQQKKEIEVFEAMKKRGVIYEIFFKGDQNESYIGSHQGIDPKDRFKTHINSALQSLKQPLYRRIFREGLKEFDIRIIKFVDYYHSDELLEEENNFIDLENPSLNRGYTFEYECGKELQQEQAIYKHRQDCEDYISRPIFQVQQNITIDSINKPVL